ncbi:MAG TPA: hypothetical protein VGW78_00645 [Candidatus Babeliales bacterium]|jgi:hypothetical protein|nr:hypothetical protein [Candidatus Babeliales bacterium]
MKLYRYGIICSLLVLLGNHSIAMQPIITKNNNQESVDYTIKMMGSAVEYGRNNFDSTSINAIALVNKNLYTTCCNAEDVYYTLMGRGNKIAGWVQLICSKCFQTSCMCCARKYRGILYRQQGNTCNKAFIASPYINELITIYNKVKQISYILNPMPIASIPSFRLPREYKNSCATYKNISKLYFDQDSVCILDGLPKLKKNYCCDYYPSFYLDTVHECMISHNGICSRRQALFECNGKEYPLGILRMFPLFYKKFLKSIKTNTYNAVRNDTQTIFYAIDFYREKFLDAQKYHEEILERLFTMLSTQGQHIDPFEIDLQESILNHFRGRIDSGNKIVDDPIDLVRFALCARLAKNIKLEETFLYIYDYLAKELICWPYARDSSIYKYPLGGILASYWKDKFSERIRSDYEKVREKLTSFAVIENLVQEMKTCSSMIPIHQKLCIYIRKHNEKYHIYPWRYEDSWNACHGDTDWIQGKEFVLIHCPGTIVKASIDSTSSNSSIKAIDTLSITEERTNADKTKILITHVLKANQVISAINVTGEKNVPDRTKRNIEHELNANQVISEQKNNNTTIMYIQEKYKNILNKYTLLNTKKQILGIYAYAHTIITNSIRKILALFTI